MVYILAVISIMLGALGQFLLKLVAGNLVTGNGLGRLANSVINVNMFFALTCLGSSMLMWILVLRKLELSIAYPMVSLGYVFVMLLSFYFLQEQIYFTKILGTGLIVAGVVVLNLKF